MRLGCPGNKSFASSQASPLVQSALSGKKVKLLRVFPLALAVAGEYHGMAY